MDYPVSTLCRSLEVNPSGYYAWLQQPLSQRAMEDKVLTRQIKQYWLESGGLSGYRNIQLDLKEAGVACGRDRVLRLMRAAQIKAQRGYRKPKGMYGGKTDVTTPNYLDRQFEFDAPNQWWVSDITYIHTHEGFLFLAVVMDLFARTIVGWAMGRRMTEDLVMEALTMAYWRRKPNQTVVLHSDQGSQYNSRAYKKLLENLSIEASMSRRGNCWDNAVAESFFGNLKKEKVKRKKYATRTEARQALFHYIEMFYNPKRRHTHNHRLAPAVYEQQYFRKLERV